MKGNDSSEQHFYIIKRQLYKREVEAQRIMMNSRKGSLLRSEVAVYR